MDMPKKTVQPQGLDPAGQVVGYARVSSPDQNLDRQTTRLTEAGAQKMFTDTLSGSTRDRPGLDAAINYLRAGDTLLIVSMDRLARSLVDLHTLVDDLSSSGNLESLGLLSRSTQPRKLISSGKFETSYSVDVIVRGGV